MAPAQLLLLLLLLYISVVVFVAVAASGCIWLQVQRRCKENKEEEANFL